MNKNKIALLLAILISVSPQSLLAAERVYSEATKEEWTLATVPTLKIKNELEKSKEVEIDTNNSFGTKMFLERSSNPDFINSNIVEEWVPHTNGDTLLFILEDGETTYLRIKAKNGSDIETDFSPVLSLAEAPLMPTLAEQNTTDKSISLRLNASNGATKYYVKRQDSSKAIETNGEQFIDKTVLPGREYTYEFWAANTKESEHNRITLWTKPQPPILSDGQISYNSVSINVDTRENPDNIRIEARREKGKPEVNGKVISESGLENMTSYEYEARIISANNEMTEWIKHQTTTTIDTLKPTPDTIADLNIDVNRDKETKIDGLKDINEKQKFDASIKDSEGKLIASSTLMDAISDLEKWIGPQLELNASYQITLGIQKGEDKKSRVEKTVTVVTPSDIANKNNTTIKTTNHSVKLELGNIQNKKGTKYKVILNGEQEIETDDIALFDKLNADNLYELAIEVLRPYGSFENIGLFKVSTGKSSSQIFKEEADSIFGSIEVFGKADPKEGVAWAEALVGKEFGSGWIIKGEIKEVTKELSKSVTIFSGLEGNKSYVMIVTISDGQFTEKKEYTFTTPSTELLPKEFAEEAEKVANSIEYDTDGQHNSGKAWVDVNLLKATRMKVSATLDGKQKNLTVEGVRFETDDNTKYTMVFYVTDGKYSYQKEIEITTPNRTAPKVDNAYLEKSNIILEVISKNGLKK
ncbi:hypothetical protein ABHN05_13205 [Brevibacillus laterosporus]|uniref:hypothetical protein n=1 Tax=Brevibacillus laterosporus TaxID=1465 RepID=UPI0011290E0A|nr:hypothetical protein [Brevibacillus laterosporus]MBG9790968.1 hypothetical protein [Brevibacillus laterosporus]MBG9804909.1 hypothetical protein [Brevibacillus laterosporus]MED1790557.1 hypothetical protein [Brevibacillus laterosporus]MED4762082.1 hypothetical protein [Brevibacillus laterosporus]TPH09943.1 hypothetical protein EGH09_21545 [Brevibacillus laterosporus]